MSVKTNYKNDVKTVTQSNSNFNQINSEVIVKENTKFNKKPIFISLGGAFAITATLVVALVLTSGKGGNPTINPVSNKALARNITPIISENITKEMTRTNVLRKSLQRGLATVSATEEEEIKSLLSQFDTIIDNNNNYTTKSVVSDDVNYNYREDVTFKDLTEKECTYSLYYNQVSEKLEEDKDEKETTVTYSGVAKNELATFDFTLVTEEEVELNEKEIQTTLKLFTNADHSNYTKVESSYEIDGEETENEYKYQIYENNKKISEYSIEIEKDPTKNEVELELTYNNKQYEVTKYEQNNDTFFKVELEFSEVEKEYVYKKVITETGVNYELQSSEIEIDD